MGVLPKPIRAARAGANNIFQLQQRATELEQLQQQLGAPEIEDEKPGVFSRIIDVLSRPNYAIAGFAEEVFGDQPSVSQGVTRALAEIFSGVGGIQGEKKAFGEVLENLGVGTTTLADAFPALEGTWVGHFGSRGAAGLALDIFTDPLTYMTFGTLSAGKKVFQIGGKPAVRFLNKQGMEIAERVTKEVTDALKANDPAAMKRFAKRSVGGADEFGEMKAYRLLDREINRRVYDALRQGGDDVAKEYLQEGGIRMFGQTLVGGERLKGFYAPVVSGLSVIPGGDKALAGARWMGDAMQRVTNQIFHPFGKLGNLPSGMREKAIALKRDFMNASGAHRGRLFNMAKGAEQAYRKLEKANPDIGKKFYGVREGKIPYEKLTDAEREVYDFVVEMYDSMGKTLVDHGVLDPNQIRGNYFFHTYKNLDDLRRWHWNTDAPFSGNFSEQMTKERWFDAYDDAIDETTRVNEIARRRKAGGKAAREYPVLDPEYDVFKNLGTYINMHSDMLARTAWREEIAATFGKAIDVEDAKALYDLARPVVEEVSDEGKRIHSWFGDAKSWRDLEAEQATFFTQKGPETRTVSRSVGAFSREAGADTVKVGEPRPTGMTRVTHEVLDTRPSSLKKVKGKKGEGEKALANRAKKFMATLSDDGKREFMRQLLLRAKSNSQIAAIEKHFSDEFLDLFPTQLVGQMPPTPDATLARLLGDEAAEEIPVKSAFTGDHGMLLPRAIWEDLQTVNSRLLNTKEFPELQKMLRGFDWLNNKFKLGTYTFWPASAFRDMYSNVALSMLDIGVQAFNPAFAKHAVGILANKDGVLRTKGGIEYTYQQLRKWAQDFGVYVPGEVFAELTGEAGRAGKLIKTPLKYRGMIENEARLHLWLANIRRGVSPRDAADHVGQFLFNYGEVSTVEREVFRRFIPFYTFTRKNVELQAKMLKQNPGMVINQVKPFRKRDSENDMMMKWEREGLGIRLDRDGKTVHALQGIDLPLRNLDTLWAGGFGPTGRRIMGMVTPMLKTPLEAMTGRDFFTGGDMKRAYGPTLGRLLDSSATPQGMKDWLGFKKEVDEAGRATYTFDGVRYSMLVKSWAFSRVMSTSDRQFREYLGPDEQNTAAALLDFLTGIRYKDLNIDEQQERLLKRRIRELENSLVRRGAMRTYTRGYQPKDDGRTSL